MSSPSIMANLPTSLIIRIIRESSESRMKDRHDGARAVLTADFLRDVEQSYDTTKWKANRNRIRMMIGAFPNFVGRPGEKKLRGLYGINYAHLYGSHVQRPRFFNIHEF
jgi:hypothetical protein